METSLTVAGAHTPLRAVRVVGHSGLLHAGWHVPRGHEQSDPQQCSVPDGCREATRHSFLFWLHRFQPQQRQVYGQLCHAPEQGSAEPAPHTNQAPVRMEFPE